MNKKEEILIVINENSKLYNQFNNSKLSDEMREYICNQLKGISLKSNIDISIYHNFDMSDYEKKLVNEIRECFGLDIRGNIITKKTERNNMKKYKKLISSKIRFIEYKQKCVF